MFAIPLLQPYVQPKKQLFIEIPGVLDKFASTIYIYIQYNFYNPGQKFIGKSKKTLKCCQIRPPSPSINVMSISSPMTKNNTDTGGEGAK